MQTGELGEQKGSSNTIFGLRSTEGTQIILDELNALIGQYKTRKKNKKGSQIEYTYEDRYFSERNLSFFNDNYASVFLGRPSASEMTRTNFGESWGPENEFISFVEEEGKGSDWGAKPSAFQVNYQQKIKELFASLDLFPGDREKLMEYIELQDKVGFQSKEAKKNVKNRLDV